MPGATDPPHSVGMDPLPDESLIGFIFRLALARRAVTAMSVARSCGFENLTNHPRTSQLQALSVSARTSFGGLERISYSDGHEKTPIRFNGHRLPFSSVVKRGEAERRVCPLCLADSPYHRAAWDLIFVSVCPLHCTVLADSCRSCGKPLRWAGADLRNCGCGFDLTRMDATTLPEAEVRGTRAVLGLLGYEAFTKEGSEAASLEPYRDMEASRVVEFMFRIGLETLGARRVVFSMDRPGELAWQAHLALNAGLEVGEEWPQRFTQILDQMRARGQTDPLAALDRSVKMVREWLRERHVGSKVLDKVCREYHRAGRERHRASLAAAAAMVEPDPRCSATIWMTYERRSGW